jgi:hypothetical protein
MTLPAPTVLGTGVAVALLRIESLSEQTAGPEARYVALATEGRRLWFALAGQGRNQLVAREARLRTQGAKLLLEVDLSGQKRAVLKFDGTRFVQLN